MQEMFQDFMTVNNIFWGDDVFHWWFYIAIVLILIFETHSTTKITYAWYSVVFLIGLFSPLSNMIMSRINSAWQYRARLYSMLPIPYVLALGSIVFFDKVSCIRNKKTIEVKFTEYKSQQAIKLVLVFGACTLIVLGGTDVYKQDWMKSAQNLEKVPKAVLELKEKLGSQQDICVAVPESLSSYVRQEIPSFYTPYGRYVNSLGARISQENPDPISVMREAGAESCDYIVIYDNEINITNFQQSGYEPFDRVSGYIIYKVDGVPYIKRIYNTNRQIISILYMDENDAPTEKDQGYAGVSYEYDQDGNCNKETYLDTKGNKKTLDYGYAAVAKKYSRFSRQVVSITYLDAQDNPVLIRGRYETRNTYDSKRRWARESYFDQYGQMMNRVDTFYAYRDFVYDNQGRCVGEKYYNLNGNLVVSSYGYASFLYELDQNGNIIQETYYNINDEPMRIKTGYAGIKREFSDNGKIIREIYLDENGQPLTQHTGYAQVHWEYNELGQMYSETYWDEKGMPTNNIDGYHGIIIHYNDVGEIMSEEHITQQYQ